MRYARVREIVAIGDEKGKLTKVQLKELAPAAKLPPATPAHQPTGRSADTFGNVYELHRGNPRNGREDRRVNRFAQFTERPWRSRIQRGISKQHRQFNDDGRRVLPVSNFLQANQTS